MRINTQRDQLTDRVVGLELWSDTGGEELFFTELIEAIEGAQLKKIAVWVANQHSGREIAFFPEQS